MKNATSISYLLLAIATSLVSCQQQPINLPDPASQLVGVYLADSYVSRVGKTAFYPIQGKTMTLTLSRVSSDSVKVDLRADPNDEYSPGGNRSVERVVVNQEIEATRVGKQQVNCVGYRIDLGLPSAGSSEGEHLRLRCSTGGAIDYNFTPPGSQTAVTVQFIKI